MSEQKPNTITDIIKPELPNLMAILSINNDTSQSNISVIAMQEVNYLEQHAANNPRLLQCDQMSMILAVKSVLTKNLSLDPSAGLVYVKTRNLNVGSYERPIWKLVLEIQETVNGIISYNRQLGRLLDYKRPQLTKDTSGKVIGVSTELLLPSYPQPRWELFDFDESDIERWRRYSHRENKKSFKENKGMKVPNDEQLNYANALYTSWKDGIDPEFARAKCLRHSLKKLGSNKNEGVLLLQQPKQAPVIDPRIAHAEAEEDNLHDYTQVEEVTSTINTSSAPPQQNEHFNPNDL